MARLQSLFVAAAFAASLSALAGERCSAIDGNTLQCGRERVRVEALRSPAIDQPGGREARDRLQRRIRSGSLVVERKGRDKYGRTLGRAYVDGNRITQLDLTAQAAKRAARR